MSSSDEKSPRDPSPVEDVSSPQANLSLGRFLATRFPTLKPPMNPTPNPITLLRMLNRKQWLFFSVGALGWTADAMDFFTVR